MTREVWDIVQRALIDAEIDAYPPGKHKGDCKEPYVVVKDAGSAQLPGYSTENHLYNILCYVPLSDFLELSEFKERVKAVMAAPPIYPMLIPTGIETPSFLDDTVNGYMISIQYKNHVRNSQLHQ